MKVLTRTILSGLLLFGAATKSEADGCSSYIRQFDALREKLLSALDDVSRNSGGCSESEFVVVDRAIGLIRQRDSILSKAKSCITNTAPGSMAETLADLAKSNVEMKRLCADGMQLRGMIPDNKTGR